MEDAYYKNNFKKCISRNGDKESTSREELDIRKEYFSIFVCTFNTHDIIAMLIMILYKLN